MNQSFRNSRLEFKTFFNKKQLNVFNFHKNKETNPLKNRGRPLDAVDAVCQAHSKVQYEYISDVLVSESSHK